METAPADPSRLAIRTLLRLLTLVAAGLALWFVVAVSAAGAFRERAPELALRFVPFDARAQAVIAERLLTPGRNRARQRRIQTLAKAALRRDPTVVDGAAALGISSALADDGAGAERAFVYASRLSRRDVPTQLWLIERSVQRNDIPGALRHYDPVLRTSPAMHPILFPVLTSASAQPAIAIELNRMLRGRPNWRPDFISALLMQQSDPAALYRTTQGLLGTTDDREREQVTTLLTLLARHEAYDLAWRAYVAVRPERRAGGPGLWNGDFARDPGLPPFDWTFPEEASLMPERRSVGEGFALYLPVAAVADAEAARQLIQLAPGRYMVSALIGNVPRDPLLRPRLTVRCAAAPSPELVQADFPVVRAAGGRFSAAFTVPGGCRYQWLSLWARGSLDQPDGDGPWVAAVRVAAR